MWHSPVWLPTLLALALAGLLLRVRNAWAVYGFVVVVFCALHRLNSESAARELSRRLESAQSLTATGSVAEPPRPSGKQRSQFRLQLQSLSLDHVQYRCKAEVIVFWKGAPPECGDLVRVVALGANIPAARNPGELDQRAYLRREGIYSQFSVRYPNDANVIEAQSAGRMRRLALACRNWMERALSADLDEQTAAVICSMVLGANSRTPPPVLELFRKTGTIHLFAVSGLNVAMFAVILWAALKPFGVRKRQAAPVLGVALIFYALITGFTASGLRAALMGVIALVGFCLDRRVLLPNVLAGSAVLLLSVDTNELLKPGFQFSYAVVGALLFAVYPVQAHLVRCFGPDPFVPRKLRSVGQTIMAGLSARAAALISVSLVAWCAALPFTLFYFHMLVPVAVVMNLLVVPMAFVVLALAVLSLVCSCWATGLALIFNNANWAAAQCVLQVVRLGAVLPGGCFYLASPELEVPEGRVVIFDLGSGGAAHIMSGCGSWLLDCGTERDARRVVMPALHESGVMRLEGLILTHGDAAHVGGAIGVLEAFAPADVVVPTLSDRSPSRRAFELELSRRTIPKTLVTAGDRLGPNLRVLYPPASGQGRNADDHAMVVQVSLGQARILFMSDAGFVSQQWLLGSDIRSDLLVKGRHTTDPGCSEEFIARVDPQMVISAADPFHPDPALATLLNKRGIPFLSQDRTGAVRVSVDGDRVRVESFLGSGEVYTFKSRAR